MHYRSSHGGDLPSSAAPGDATLSLQLQPGDHPLVDLANRLGWSVFLRPDDDLKERYLVVANDERIVQNESLVEALATLIQITLQPPASTGRVPQVEEHSRTAE